LGSGLLGRSCFGGLVMDILLVPVISRGGILLKGKIKLLILNVCSSVKIYSQAALIMQLI
jgi:hypothetical protein